MAQRYDLVVIGTGPAAAFFLHGYLAKAPPSARVLVLEKGKKRPHSWQLEHKKSLLSESLRHVEFRKRGANDKKRWKFGVALGGSSNLWWACTPRLLPADFELQTRYGVGEDWPVGYDDLEPYYCEAESIMGVAGPSNDSPFERSKPYPHAPHAMTKPERLLKEAYPDQVFSLPSARPTAQHGGRPACCNSGICGLCPVNSKFTVLNQLSEHFEDPRVTLEVGHAAKAIETQAGVAHAVVYGEADKRAEAELFAVGAGAFFNPILLLRSNIQGGPVGKYLHEQVSVHANIYLDGVDNFQGSSAITGHGYQLYDGEHRKEHAAGLIEMWNVPSFRIEPGKWRQILKMQLIYEDLPLEENRVELRADTDKPHVFFNKRSDYAKKAIKRAQEDLERVFEPLPVEKISVTGPRDTEGHVLGTTRMGRDPATSVVDGDMRHHSVRNLLMLGGSTYPVSSPSNPTLTIAALSLRAAARLGGS